MFVANLSLPHLVHPAYLEWGTVTEMGLAFTTTATIMFTEIAQSYLSSVSYTHLDVYKRQF